MFDLEDLWIECHRGEEKPHGTAWMVGLVLLVLICLAIAAMDGWGKV